MASLEDLKRQREMIARHLAWLDDEIAAATDGEPSAPDNSKTAPCAPPAQEIPERFLLESAETRASLRKGCLAGFGLLLLALLAALTLVYWLFYR